MDRIVIDSFENDNFKANNWDGGEPEIEDGIIYAKELDCYPECGCGGCHVVTTAYPIGENKDSGNRYYYKDINRDDDIQH